MDPAFCESPRVCRLIGREEGLSPEEQFLLEAAAYVHDIGIRPAEEKYGGLRRKASGAGGSSGG